MAIATVTKEIFPWKDAYSVGIPQIDAQHKGLIKLINDLHSGMSTGQGQKVLGKILDELVRYTEVHFSSEVALLRQKSFSKLAEHLAEHQRLTAQVVELRDKYRAGEITLTVEVMHFLRSWLADHIMGFDQAYARELKTVAVK